MVNAGFADVEVSLEAAPVRMQDRSRYREFVGKIVLPPFLYTLAPQLRDEFTQQVVEEAAMDQGLVVDFVRINISGLRS
jgi:hypothetical protein